MWPFSSRESLEETGKRLRRYAMKLRILGQFDAACKRYKEAYRIYVKTGDTDAQCNVLCSLAESSQGEARQEYLKLLATTCDNIKDPDKRSQAQGNLQALRQRLQDT